MGFHRARPLLRSFDNEYIGLARRIFRGGDFKMRGIGNFMAPVRDQLVGQIAREMPLIPGFEPVFTVNNVPGAAGPLCAAGGCPPCARQWQLGRCK